MNEIDFYLNEDLGEEGDITSDSLFTDEIGKAHILAKDDCIVAGLDEAFMVFLNTGANLSKEVIDGEEIKSGSIVAEVSGSVKSILKGERLALNFICRMSGIASETRRLIDICKSVNSSVSIAATRKTTPGFRKYEKKAVALGGGEPHRMGLFDVVMIKDNHLKCFGSVEDAIKKAQKNVKDKIIEVEVESEIDAVIAAKLGVDVIMLDNFSINDLKSVVDNIKKINSKVLIEISGGISSENILDYAVFADRISLGCLTHSVKSIDFSLDFM